MREGEKDIQMKAAPPPTAKATAKLLSNIFKMKPINKETSNCGITTKILRTPVNGRRGNKEEGVSERVR